MAADAVPQTRSRLRGQGSAVRPSARGWLSLATGAVLVVAGVAAGYPTVRGLGLALLALHAVSLASVLLRVPVAVQRTISPARVARLDPCQGRLGLGNSSTRFGVSLDAQDRVGGRPVDVDVPWLGAGDQREVVFDLPTERMGRLTIGPMTLRRNGFAGLWTRVMDLGDTRDLLVTPQLHRCKGVPAGLTRGHAGADERVERGGTDLTGLREYVPGDDLRRLHWATTARTGTLMIREDSDPSRAHLTVLVDDSPASIREPGDLDEMADIAASLLRAAVADGNPCRLVSLSGRADVELPAGIGQAVDPVGVLEPALVALCDLATELGTEQPVTPALHGTDVLVAVGSRHSDRTRLATLAGGLRPTLLLVDPTAEAAVTWAGGSPTLSGARARDVLATWDVVSS